MRLAEVVKRAKQPLFSSRTLLVMILFAELASVVISFFNYPWAAADTRAHMHFDELKVERVKVLEAFCNHKEYEV